MPAVVSLGMLRWGCWAESHVQEGFVCLNVCALIQGRLLKRNTSVQNTLRAATLGRERRAEP